MPEAGLLPIDPGARRAILQAVDGLADDSTALLAQLVRHRSLLGEEAGCLDAMAEAFAGLGLLPRRVPVDAEALAGAPGFSPPLIPYAGRDNVAAVHRPREVRGAQPDAARPRRRGAGGRGRPMDHAAVRAERPRRAHVRPGRRRHEGGPRLDRHGLRGAAPGRAAAGGGAATGRRDRGGVHRQRRARGDARPAAPGRLPDPRTRPGLPRVVCGGGRRGLGVGHGHWDALPTCARCRRA